MRELEKLLGKLVEAELSGHIKHNGMAVDCGLDILVIYDGRRYLYVPSTHIQHIRESIEAEQQISQLVESPIEDGSNAISYRKILNHAKGEFSEIYVTGGQTLHGYITNVMNDYFTFYSPVYKTMLISMDHMKWLTPYPINSTPYSLRQDQLPVHPTQMTLSRTFAEQLKRFTGKLIVFDVAANQNKIGLLNKIDGQTIELVNAKEEKIFLNLRHVKTAHMPWMD